MYDAAAPPAPTANLDLDLLVTAHFVFAGQVGGAEHMLYNLLRGMVELGAHPRVLCGAETNLDPAFVAEFRRTAGPDALLATGSGNGSRFIAEQRACFDRSLSASATLFTNYFVPPFVPGRLGRVASVIHDMQFRHFPEHFAAKKRVWLAAAQALSMRRSDRVIAISNFVREDLLRVFGRRFERKVVTVPNPISWDRFGNPDRPSRPLDRPYILAVAAQYAHKNLETLVRAFAGVARAEPDLILVLAGQPYGSLRGVPQRDEGSLAKLVRALDLNDRVHVTGYLDDLTLGNWYRHAEVFAFPSLFEGFGMPPVEALGLGIPTVTSRRTALPEVTMGLATYIDDPLDAVAWTQTLLEIVRAPDRYRPDPVRMQSLRARYHPTQVATEYLAALS